MTDKRQNEIQMEDRHINPTRKTINWDVEFRGVIVVLKSDKGKFTLE